MTLTVVSIFLVLHFIIALVTAMMVAWSGGAPGAGESLLAATPVAPLLGGSSLFSDVGNFNLTSVLTTGIGALKSIWGLFWFDYAILQGHELMNLFHIGLRLFGMAVLIVLVVTTLIRIID